MTIIRLINIKEDVAVDGVDLQSEFGRFDGLPQNRTNPWSGPRSKRKPRPLTRSPALLAVFRPKPADAHHDGDRDEHATGDFKRGLFV